VLSLDELTAVINALITAVRNGELDEKLALTASSGLTPR
jgi:hypothetical protein